MRKTGLGALTVALIALTGCAGSPSAQSEPDQRTVTVSYIARASQPGNESLPSSATVSYTTDSGTSQTDITEMLMNGSGDEGLDFDVPVGTPYSVSIQNQKSTGLVICAAYLDGEQVSKNYTSAAYGVATCSGVAE